jgi:hypothetical protein
LRKLRAIALAVVAASFLFGCASSQAATFTIGSPLTGEFEGARSATAATFANLALPGAGTTVDSPIDGTVVRWRMKGMYAIGEYQLQVLTPVSPGKYTVTATSTALTVSGTPAIQTSLAALAIEEGDLIGLHPLGFGGAPTGTVAGATGGILHENPLGSPLETGNEFANEQYGFNADVQALPSVTTIAPSTGPAAGGTAVTIAGTDFEEVTSVGFGGTPAASYTVDSDGQITAIAPASKVGGPVDVSVTTLAGTSSGTFTYGAPAAEAGTGTGSTPPPAGGGTGTGTIAPPPATCVVPKLAGVKLKAAKKKLQKADCKIGTVAKKEGATGKTGRVKKQSPKAGKVLAPGSKVKVTLKP